MDFDRDGLLTLKEAARFLGVSKISLRRWTKDGSLTCIRFGKRGDRRFRLNDLEAHIRSHIAKPESRALKSTPALHHMKPAHTNAALGERESHASAESQ